MTSDQELRALILSLDDGPQKRAAETEAEIRAALIKAGNTRLGVNRALHRLQGELAEVRRVRAWEADLICAQLAGTILAIAVQVPDWIPDRPAGGWPADGTQLTVVFARNLTQTLEGDQ